MSKSVASIVESEAFKSLSIVELGDLAEACRVEAETQRQTKAKEMKALFEAQAKEQGLSLAEVLGGSTSGKANKKRSTVAPKYKNPSNASQVWSGRGRKPQWVQEHLEAGGQVEELAIA